MADESDYKVLVNEKGERFIEYKGEIYPEGFVPDPELSERELYIARKKERIWTWTIRLGILAVIVFAILLIISE